MLRYVDSAIIIYFLERADDFHTRAAAWLAGFQAAGDELAVTDLSRLECRVGPLKRGVHQRVQAEEKHHTLQSQEDVTRQV